jgi:hypothetical protein
MKDLPPSFPVRLDRGIPGAVANCGGGRPRRPVPRTIIGSRLPATHAKVCGPASSRLTVGFLSSFTGQKVPIGGTGASVPLWAGLIALINQALGHNVGYLNPRLYREMGPAGLFNTITSGDNGVGGVKGYTAGPGWTPVAGWGSPDGMKLLTWLRANPDTNRGSAAMRADCRPSAG